MLGDRLLLTVLGKEEVEGGGREDKRGGEQGTVFRSQEKKKAE